MSDNDFDSRMEKLQKPNVNPEAAEHQFKLMLMNTSKSAIWGFWLVLIPFLFILGNVLKELFGWKLGIINSFIEFVAKLDHQASTSWLTPLVFVLLPGIGIIINILAITHFAYRKSSRELAVTIKLNWRNIILIAITVFMLAVMALYVVSENAGHKALSSG